MFRKATLATAATAAFTPTTFAEFFTIRCIFL